MNNIEKNEPRSSQKVLYFNAQPLIQQLDFRTVANFMFSLMLRNITNSGWVLQGTGGIDSKPGCIIASPSQPPSDEAQPHVTNQDYVHHWTRDAAITAVEVANFEVPVLQALEDYVGFSSIIQADQRNIDLGCFKVDGTPRVWSKQSDGPALRIISLIEAWQKLSSNSQTNARTIIAKDLDFLLSIYQNKTTNLWEETFGYSFFTRAVQCKCFKEIFNKAESIGIRLTNGKRNSLRTAIDTLTTQIEDHWDDSEKHYRSILGCKSGSEGEDLNIDVVMASIYGDISCINPKMLSTASQMRENSVNSYQINTNSQLGPLIGRYPYDDYDGDTGDSVNEGHPWIPCTCNFAELYYMIAEIFNKDNSRIAVVNDPLCSTFFNDIGISVGIEVAEAVTRLRNAGDAMLWAVVFHSDHLELSEQFDRNNGYEKSVRNLTWSYASFISAVRARERI